MTVRAGWRPISTEEEAVIRTILCRAKIRGTRVLLDQLDSAMVSHSTEWVLNVAAAGGSSGLPSGPFPARAFITSSADYHGEVIVWITDGRVSGLEFAWIGDEPPRRWPRPEEIDVVSEAGGIGT